MAGQHLPHLVAVVALDLGSHALPADAAQQLPALLLDVLNAVDGLHAAREGGGMV